MKTFKFKFSSPLGMFAAGLFVKDLQSVFNAYCEATGRDGEVTITFSSNSSVITKNSLIQSADLALQNHGHGGSEWLFSIRKESNSEDKRMAVLVEDFVNIFCLNDKNEKITKFVLLESKNSVLAIVPEGGVLYIETKDEHYFLIGDGVCTEVAELPKAVHKNICVQS